MTLSIKIYMNVYCNIYDMQLKLQLNPSIYLIYLPCPTRSTKISDTMAMPIPNADTA